MLSEKAKRVETEAPGFSPTAAFEGKKTAASGKKQGNVLPLERPRSTAGLIKAAPAVAEATVPSAETASDVGEIKSRLDNVLARMKSRTANADAVADDALTQPATGSAPINTAPVQTSKEQLLNDPSKDTFSEELERRRAAIIAIAREAEVRAREADETYRQAETRLKQETELRLAAEQRVNELEQETKQWLAVAQTEETKRIEAEAARRELETRLREESLARAEAERTVTLAGTRAEEAERARVEAGLRAETAEQSLREAERQRDEAAARARAAEEAAREVEALINEADAIARAAEERCQTAEANLRREAELRVLAEQTLQEVASLSPQLALSLGNLGASPATANYDLSATDQDALRQLRAQFENEQKARHEAEVAARAAEAQLRKVEEKHRVSENGYKKVLRKQEEELRSLSGQAPRASSTETTAPPPNGADQVSFASVEETSDLRTKIKFVSYGAVITLLLLALVWLGVTTVQQF